MPENQKPPGELRLGDKWLEFVGEGSANTIWELHFTQKTGGDAATQELRRRCNGFLLRIQKTQAGLDGADSSHTAEEQLSYYQDVIFPLFNNDSSVLVAQELIGLSQPIIDEANAVLAELDENHEKPDSHPHLPARARKFVSSRVGPSGSHLLVENFRSRGGREHFAEIKPKWLAQSPTAPSASNTCRNCAVAAKRYTEAPEGKKPKKSDPEKFGCPLHLVNPAPESDEADLPKDWKVHAERIFRHDDPRHSHFLYRSVRQHHILHHLRELQNRFAHQDTFLTTTAEEPDMDLLLTMTLRDCSLFFRYEETPAESDGATSKLTMVDLKLADLDKKASSKIPSWQDTERGLIDGRWYEGKGGEAMPHCFLKVRKPDDGTPADLSKLKNKAVLGVPYEE